MLLRLVGLVNLIFILSSLINFQGRESNFGSIFVQIFDLDFHWDILQTDFFQTWYDDRHH